MLNFQFCSPTEFLFGRDTESQTGECVRKHGGTRVLVHYGGGSVERSGLLGRVLSSLDAVSIPYFTLGGAVPNPRSGLVYEGIELCRRESIDFVLCVGGGSAIDSGKAIALGIHYDGDFWDFFSGKTGAPAHPILPVGVVLTLPAAGSEGSTASVITHEDGMFKRGYNIEQFRPRFAVLNPELTYTLPSYQTACGVSDMMCHIFERYFTNTPDVDLTDRLAEALLQAIIYAAPTAIREPNNYEARAQLMWAGMLAHNNLVGVDREQDWASHSIEHELSALYDVAHGAGLSVVYPAWMRYQLDHDPMRFAQIATRVWGCDMDYQHPERTANEGIERLTAFWSSLGLPVTFAELEAKPEDIPALAAKTALGPDGLLGSFRPLDVKAIEAILRLACR
ncbi:MAG: iron-containing alcohol dehydrogenase [Clostridia bacterium]|nr:iron-containing alcohol dehydrogenase [Clostridia bacterium]